MNAFEISNEQVLEVDYYYDFMQFLEYVLKNGIKRTATGNISLNNINELSKRFKNGKALEFLDEYGGGPESFNNQACKHLEGYLRLVLQIEDKAKKEELIEQLWFYLIRKNNIYTDDKDETFENVAGISVNR